MHDIRAIRSDPDGFDAALAKRGLDPLAASLLELDAGRRTDIAEEQERQTRLKAASKAIGKAKAANDEAEVRRLMAEVADLKHRMSISADVERAFGKDLNEKLLGLPNLPVDDVPVGEDESDNVELRKVGTPPAIENPQAHDDLGEALGLFDAEIAAKISGARFTVLRGPLARLERALGQFMIDLHTTEHGYTEISPPLLVREAALIGTAQLPKFAEDQFKTTDDRWLIPTAEVPLTNLVRESVLDAASLPIRVTALTHCFRAEAGSAGRDTKGMLRQHQFQKCELVSITTPESSADEQERMTGCAEEVLKRLEIPYRVVTLCTGDLGFAAQRTYDIEAWVPSQDTYREISSCSVCGDFQARRMNARYRPKADAPPQFVHTLNGSGVAVGRALIAVMENFQQADGSITIPDALRPYTGFERIAADGH